MGYQIKHQIAKLLRESINKFQKADEQMHKISKRVTHYLQQKYEGAWICTLGRKFTANVVHQPGFFLRASTQDYHILILKLRVPSKQQKQQRKQISPIRNDTPVNKGQDKKINPIINLFSLS